MLLITPTLPTDPVAELPANTKENTTDPTDPVADTPVKGTAGVAYPTEPVAKLPVSATVPVFVKPNDPTAPVA